MPSRKKESPGEDPAKLPALQFYPGDWRKDAGVQSLNYHDRGIWWELLLLMHASHHRGTLTWPSGDPMGDDAIAQLLGIGAAEWQQTRSTLVSRGVASVEGSTGMLYNRRMLRDEALRQSKIRGGLARHGLLPSRRPAEGQQDVSKTSAKRGSSTTTTSSTSVNPARPAIPGAQGDTPADVGTDPTTTGEGGDAVAVADPDGDALLEQSAKEVAIPLLTGVGVQDAMAARLAGEAPIREVVLAVAASKGQQKPAGFAVQALKDGWFARTQLPPSVRVEVLATIRARVPAYLRAAAHVPDPETLRKPGETDDQFCQRMNERLKARAAKAKEAKK